MEIESDTPRTVLGNCNFKANYSHQEIQNNVIIKGRAERTRAGFRFQNLSARTSFGDPNPFHDPTSLTPFASYWLSFSRLFWSTVMASAKIATLVIRVSASLHLQTRPAKQYAYRPWPNP